MTDIPPDPHPSGDQQPGASELAAPGPSPAAAGGTGDPAELLVRAVSSLAPADRDRVYLWLLRRQQISAPGAAWAASLQGLVGGQTTAMLQEAGMTTAALREAAGRATAALRQAGMASGQQMVPVRFSSEQHTRLREWCAEHGFSMATSSAGW